MKKLSRYLSLAVLYLIITASSVSSQVNISISPGLGIPEFMNLGLRVHTGQAAIGLQAGLWPQRTHSVTSAGAGLTYHFAGHSQHSNIRPWYAKNYVRYIRDESPERIFQDVYLDLRAGRVFNITSQSGLEADIGLAFNLYNSFERTSPGPFILDLTFPVIPTLGIRWFYRL